MQIKILTPSKKIVEASADALLATGPKGEFEILPGHAHYLSPLTLGRLKLSQGGVEKSYLVEGGFLEVLEDQITIGADSVETPDQIDRASSEKQLQELSEKLGTDTLEPGEFEEISLARDRQAARLEVLA